MVPSKTFSNNSNYLSIINKTSIYILLNIHLNTNCTYNVVNTEYHV